MDVEILLDCSEVTDADRPEVDRRFQRWYEMGAEVRHNKLSFSSISKIGDNRYLVDIGYADLISSFRNLHAMLRYLGVKVFIHFTQ